MSREDAYRVVQGCAHQAWNTENGNFRKLIENNNEVTELLSQEDINTCFDPNQHLANLDVIYERLGI